MNDYATDKRTRWIQEAQEISWVEVIEAKDFVMILPLVLSFDGNQEARTTVAASGPVTPFELKVPIKPRKVELDPFSWILSERTTSRAK